MKPQYQILIALGLVILGASVSYYFEGPPIIEDESPNAEFAGGLANKGMIISGANMDSARIVAWHEDITVKAPPTVYRIHTGRDYNPATDQYSIIIAVDDYPVNMVFVDLIRGHQKNEFKWSFHYTGTLKQCRRMKIIKMREAQEISDRLNNNPL